MTIDYELSQDLIASQGPQRRSLSLESPIAMKAEQCRRSDERLISFLPL